MFHARNSYSLQAGMPPIDEILESSRRSSPHPCSMALAYLGNPVAQTSLPVSSSDFDDFGFASLGFRPVFYVVTGKMTIHPSAHQV